MARDQVPGLSQISQAKLPTTSQPVQISLTTYWNAISNANQGAEVANMATIPQSAVHSTCSSSTCFTPSRSWDVAKQKDVGHQAAIEAWAEQRCDDLEHGRFVAVLDALRSWRLRVGPQVKTWISSVGRFPSSSLTVLAFRCPYWGISRLTGNTRERN